MISVTAEVSVTCSRECSSWHLGKNFQRWRFRQFWVELIVKKEKESHMLNILCFTSDVTRNLCSSNQVACGRA